MTAATVTRAAVGGATRAHSRYAWRSLASAGCSFAILAAFAGCYGNHGDELYFLEAGRHLAWGIPISRRSHRSWHD